MELTLIQKCETEQIYEVINFKKNTGVRFYTSVDDNTYVPPHWHDAIEIVLIQEGKLLYSVEGNEAIINSGECMLVNANVVHSTKCLGPNKAIVFQIPLPFFENYVPEIKSLRFDINHPTDDDHKNKLMNEHFIACLETMQVMTVNKKKHYSLEFNSYLFDVLHQLCQNFSYKAYSYDIKQRKKDLERLSVVLEYIKLHYKDNISIKKIASIACLQEGYFCRFFKKNMGITFLEYHNEIRLNFIHQDLELTAEPLKNLLEKHGFSNYKLFRKMFNSQFNCTPSEYRKRIKSDR